MANRKRKIVLRVPVTAEEQALIQQKMALLHTANFSAYARKMLMLATLPLPPFRFPPSSVLIKRIGTPKLCAKGWKFPKKRKKIEAALRSRKATSICFR